MIFVHCGDALGFVSAYLAKKSLDYLNIYEGWNFNSDNYLFTTDTK